MEPQTPRGCKPGEVSRVVKQANLAKKKGDFVKAEQLYKQGMTSCITMTGPETLEVVKWLNLLAQAQKQQGKVEDAMENHRKSLTIREKLLGDDHSLVARTLNNLAILLEKTGAFEEAEGMYRRSLAISEKHHKEDHSDVATALNNLAGVLEKTRRFAGAEELYLRALGIMENTNGPDHPDTATLIHNIAVVLKMQNRVEEAVGYYKRALRIRQAYFGNDSLVLAKSQTSLAVALAMIGDKKGSEKLFRLALSIEQNHAEENPSNVQAWKTLGNTAASLADCLVALKRYSDAVPLYAQAAECREGILGLDHPQVAATRMLQASALRMNGNVDSAAELLQEARKQYLEAGVEGIISIIEVDIELAQCLISQGNSAEAEAIMSKTFEEHAGDPGIAPLLAAQIRCTLGTAMLARHGWAKAMEAEALGRMAMEIVQDVAGPQAAEMVPALNLVAEALKHMENREEERDGLLQEVASIEHESSITNVSLSMSLVDGHVLKRKQEGNPRDLENLEVDDFRPETQRHHYSSAAAEESVARRDVSEPIHEDFQAEKEAVQEMQQDKDSSRSKASAGSVVKADAIQINVITDSRPLSPAAGPKSQRSHDSSGNTLSLAESLDHSANYLSGEAKLDEAIPLYRMALEIRQKVLGDSHLAVATSLNNLAVSLKRKGQYQEAEEAYAKALSIRKSAMGEDHPSVAQSMHNLATLKDAMGSHEEAEMLYRTAIKIREEKLGHNSAKLASSLGNLGGLLESLGRYEEAEALYRRVLGIRNAAHKNSPSHPEVMAAQTRLALLLKCRGKLDKAQSLLQSALKAAEAAEPHDVRHIAAATMNLASVKRAADDFAGAEELCCHALSLLETALGPFHQDVAAAQNNLADLIQCQGRLDEAEVLYKKSIEGLESALGPTHPALNTPVSNLADLLAEKGNEQESRRWYKRAIEVTRSSTISGSTVSPQVATSANNQGVLQHEKRKMSAEPTLRRALEVREKALGPLHPDVGDSLYALGTVLLEKGKLQEALPMLYRAVQVREHALGPAHPEVGSAMVVLGDALQQNGQFMEAEQYYRSGVDIRKDILGRDHCDLVVLLNNLSVVMHKNGKNSQAELLQRRALEIGRERLGPRHEQVATAQCNLAFLAAASGRLEEAESLLRRGLDIRREVLGIAHPSLVLTLKNLAGVLEQREKHGQALELYTQAVVLKERQNGVDGVVDDPELVLLQAKVVELADRNSYKPGRRGGKMCGLLPGRPGRKAGQAVQPGCSPCVIS